MARKTYFCLLTFLLMWPYTVGVARVAPGAAQQLIDSTSLTEILRTDADQAALTADQISKDLPAELRSELRLAVDQNLAYDKMEAALVKAIATTLDPAALGDYLRWWSSPTGRAISLMESTIYASAFANSTFRTFNPQVESGHATSSKELTEVLTDSRFAEFVTSLLSSDEKARNCLLLTINVQPGCEVGEDTAQRVDQALLQKEITGAASAAAAAVTSGDLSAYLTYLRSHSTQTVSSALHASLLAVERRGWDNARKQANAAIESYVRHQIAPGRQATLRQVTADVDFARDLGHARITLEFLRRAGPADPAVLVQLARVALEQAPNARTEDTSPFLPRLDAISLQTAQHWLDEALALDANRSETLMMLGYVAYLKEDFKRSLTLLEEARKIGPDSAWLLVDLGETLWASGSIGARNDALIRNAVDDFEAALSLHPPDGARYVALHELSAAYVALGDIGTAGSFHRQLISMSHGQAKAYLLRRYALFLMLAAGDVDASLAAMREAVGIYDFELGRNFLANVLTVKAGRLYSAGLAKEAAAYVAEARTVWPDLESTSPGLARVPAMFPGVLALHSAGLLKNFSGSIGGQTLVFASRYATGAEIKQLLAWGANPNYADAEEGAPLHAAILGENIPAITALLNAGANPLAPYVDGRTPAQMTNSSTPAKIAQICALVVTAAQERTAKTVPIGTPLRSGYRYRVTKPIGGISLGNDLATGEEFTFLNNDCRYQDTTFTCFNVRRAVEPDEVRDVAVSKAQLNSWSDWFEELGPDKSKASRQNCTSRQN